MKTFKTPKGTELPLLELQGKPYLQPAHRLTWFREENPNWSILSSISMFGENFVRAEVSIYDENRIERARANSVYKFEENAAEGAETGAMGRALAWLGFGTQFTAEDSNERRPVVDSPISPAKKSPFKNHAQKPPAVAAMEPLSSSDYKVDFGKHSGKTLAEVTKPVAQGYAEYLIDQAKIDNKPLNVRAQKFIDEVNRVWPSGPPPPSLDESESIPF